MGEGRGGGGNSAISLQEIRISTCARSNSDRIPPAGSKGTNADRRSINRRDKRVIQRGARGWNVYTESNDRHRANAKPRCSTANRFHRLSSDRSPAAIFQGHIRPDYEPESHFSQLPPCVRSLLREFFHRANQLFFFSLRVRVFTCFFRD